MIFFQKFVLYVHLKGISRKKFQPFETTEQL